MVLAVAMGRLAVSAGGLESAELYLRLSVSCIVSCE